MLMSFLHSDQRAVKSRLDWICCHQVDPEIISRLDKVSLLEIEMGLITPDIVWIPELGSSNTSSSVRDMFNKWIRSYLEIARLVKRLDIGEGTPAATPAMMAKLPVQRVSSSSKIAPVSKSGLQGCSHIANR